MMKLCLFLTYGMSFKRWDELGILEREISLYQKLSELGIQVSCFTYGDKEDLSYAESFPFLKIFPVYVYLKKPKTKIEKLLQSLTFAKKFKDFFREHDLLKTNQMWGVWVALAVKRSVRKPLLLRAGYEAYQAACFEKKPWIFRCFLFILSWAAYHKADRMILTSQTAKQFVKKTFGISEENIDIIPNFIEESSILIDNSRPLYDHRTLFVGRLVEAKNLFSTMKACSHLKLGLDIIGDGPLRIQLESYAETLQLDVRFLGKLKHEDVLKEIPKYPFCLLPSYYEGSPKALLEIMACGRAVVGGRVQGIEEIIQDGETGILTGLKAEEIAAGIEKLLLSPSFCQKLGENAQAEIRKKYSLEVLREKELLIYQELIQSDIRFGENLCRLQQ